MHDNCDIFSSRYRFKRIQLEALADDSEAKESISRDAHPEAYPDLFSPTEEMGVHQASQETQGGAPFLEHQPVVEAVSPFASVIQDKEFIQTESQLLVQERISHTSSFSRWNVLLHHPIVKLVVGLVLGIGLLFFVATLVDLPKTVQIIQQHLTTPRGLLYGFLASSVFLLAFVVRALRWKLFLQSVGKVKTRRVLQLFMVGVFLNFLVPIRIGEVAKSVLLKRISDIPMGQSLSTITIDKVFDLLPALFIVALVSLFGIHLDSRFWIVLGLANVVLLGMILFVILSAWKQQRAFSILRALTKFLPHAVGAKIEGFAVGFVGAMLLSARRPRIFLYAAGMTVVAVCLDGLYNYFSFWALGYPITFGQALFGYMVFNIFYILPNPPGQVGSNEVVGLLIFHVLLHIPAEIVLAMIGLFHVWSGVLMCGAGLLSLSSLGVSFSSAIKIRPPGEVRSDHLTREE